MMQYTLTIAEIRQETEDTVTLILKQPGLKKIKYQAGQYLTLVFRINNRKYVRPYSFSSAPGIDSTLNITVKRVNRGVISNHIADFLKSGDVIEVLQPMGDFTLENKKIQPNDYLVFWGAGSGITPLFSMIKYALHYKFAKHITLVYGNRNHEQTVFAEQINSLQKQYPDLFSVWHFHTQYKIVGTNPGLIEGRINPTQILNVLGQENKIENSYHFICGPNGLKESVEAVLKSQFIAEDHIFSEDFNLAVDPKQFEGIVTQKVVLKTASAIHRIEVIKGKTILEAGLDASIDLAYSCQTGTCLLCKAKLISGKLKSIASSADNRLLETDEHLLCCSLPVSDDVELLVSSNYRS